DFKRYIAITILLIYNMAINEAMNPATVDESRSRHHPWWKSKYVIYDIVIHILVIVSNVATFLYLRNYKIPIAGDKIYMIELVVFYCFSGTLGVVEWVDTFKNIPEMEFKGGSMDRISHIFGLVFLIVLLYSISPVFALCFGIPSSVWFLSVLIYTLYVLCCGRHRTSFPSLC
ncbi:unnamed protein product, partial [Arabidopsis halleri]